MKTDSAEAKYNYVLAAALDTGLALSAIIIFFCITYPGGVFPDWWGEYSEFERTCTYTRAYN